MDNMIYLEISRLTQSLIDEVVIIEYNRLSTPMRSLEKLSLVVEKINDYH